MFALQVLDHAGGASVPCQVAFAKVADNARSRAVQREMLPNVRPLLSQRLVRFSHVIKRQDPLDTLLQRSLPPTHSTLFLRR